MSTLLKLSALAVLLASRAMGDAPPVIRIYSDTQCQNFVHQWDCDDGQSLIVEDGGIQSYQIMTKSDGCQNEGGPSVYETWAL